jgi:hypothetical protein
LQGGLFTDIKIKQNKEALQFQMLHTALFSITLFHKQITKKAISKMFFETALLNQTIKYFTSSPTEFLQQSARLR